MSNLFSLYFHTSLRKWIDINNKRKIPIFSLVLLIIFITLQSQAIPTYNQERINTIGWVIVALYLIYALYGLISNRLPSKMEDVIWIYTLPMSMKKIVWSLVIWNFCLRGGIWFISALLADILRLILNLSYAHLFIHALIGVWVICLLELLLFAMSSTRGNRKLCLTIGVLIFIGVILYSTSIYYIHNNISINSSLVVFFDTVAHGIGNLLFGNINFPGVLVVICLSILATIIIHISTKDPRLKEKLVREAEFWSEFKDFNSMVSSVQNKQQESWWGGEYLTGTFSFIWYEMLIMRKHKLSLILQYFLGLILIICICKFFPNAIWTFLAAILFSSIIGSYFSGLIRHAQTHDLFLLPGKLLTKILLLETLYILPAFLVVASYILIGNTVGFKVITDNLYFLTLLPSLYIVILILRISVFYSTFIISINTSIGDYFKKLIVYLTMYLLVISIFLWAGILLKLSTINAINLSLIIVSILSFITLYRKKHLATTKGREQNVKLKTY
ncbi:MULTISPECIES: sporulation killing factor system integral membrane protein [Bacillaceae]|uniref:sporulation killing factor system integral membrane protein n=1 Tax=Bacillaceae TaxID=186817 RepID=UPI0006600972|nr:MULTISPECIES: sporulation killing factor system integral membrane protein [Bacillaceae]MCF7623774.1 sporulation killing factor system integral membrane protein [Peribacillus frigoritolerans]PRA84680.1 sporulation killing factor system integral membrane protein [Peribacillus simplex]